MRAHEILNELRVRYKSKKTSNNSYDIIIHRGKVWLFDRTYDFENKKLIDDLIDSLSLNVGDDYEMGNFNIGHIIDQLQDHRPDVLVGHIGLEAKTLFIDTYGIKQSPYTSKQIKDVMKMFNLETVETTDVETEDEIYIDMFQVKGKVPDVLYHGTNSNYISSIIKKGVMPVEHGNYKKIKFPDYIFLTADQREALSQAISQYHSTGGIPIVIKLKTPDKNRLILDYDVAMTLYGYDHPEVKKLGYDAAIILAYDDDTWPNLIQAVNKGTDLNTQMGIFGYKGRIPASHIVGIIASLDEYDRELSYDQWTHFTLSEFKEAWDLYSEFGFWYLGMEAEDYEDDEE